MKPVKSFKEFAKINEAKVPSYTDKFTIEHGDDEIMLIRTFRSAEFDEDINVPLMLIVKCQDLRKSGAVPEEDLEGSKDVNCYVDIIPEMSYFSKAYLSRVSNASGRHTSYDDINSYGGGVPLNMKELDYTFDSLDEAEAYWTSPEIQNKLSAYSGMIGFILDKAVNGIGTTGWDRLSEMIDMKKLSRKDTIKSIRTESVVTEHKDDRLTLSPEIQAEYDKLYADRIEAEGKIKVLVAKLGGIQMPYVSGRPLKWYYKKEDDSRVVVPEEYQKELDELQEHLTKFEDFESDLQNRHEPHYESAKSSVKSFTQFHKITWKNESFMNEALSVYKKEKNWTVEYFPSTSDKLKIVTGFPSKEAAEEWVKKKGLEDAYELDIYQKTYIQGENESSSVSSSSVSSFKQSHKINEVKTKENLLTLDEAKSKFKGYYFVTIPYKLWNYNNPDKAITSWLKEQEKDNNKKLISATWTTDKVMHIITSSEIYDVNDVTEEQYDAYYKSLKEYKGKIKVEESIVPSFKQFHKINETGEWDRSVTWEWVKENPEEAANDDQGSMILDLEEKLNMLESELAPPPAGVTIEIVDIIGFDNYQGAYAWVKINDKKYKVWATDNGGLWIENYPVDNTSEKGNRAGLEGFPHEIAEIIADHEKTGIEHQPDVSEAAGTPKTGVYNKSYKVGDKFYDNRYDKIAEIVKGKDGLVSWKYFNKTGTEFENDSIHSVTKEHFATLIEQGEHGNNQGIRLHSVPMKETITNEATETPSFSKDTNKWFDALVEEVKLNKFDNKQIKNILKISKKTATKENLDSLINVLTYNVPKTTKTLGKIVEQIVKIQENKYKEEFKNQYGGKPGDVSKVSAASSLFDEINQALEYYKEFKNESNSIVKSFKNFHKVNESTDATHGSYLSVEPLPNGNLKVSLTDIGKEELKELMENAGLKDFEENLPKLYDIFTDLWDDVQSNSELIFHKDIGDAGFGLTSAPGITDGYYYEGEDRHNLYKTNYPESAEVYWFPDYMVIDPIAELFEKGEVIFTKADDVQTQAQPSVQESASVGELDPTRVAEVLKHYMIAALWSSTNPDNEEEEFLDENHEIEDITPELYKIMEEKVKKFMIENAEDIEKTGMTDDQLGHDLWLSSNGHGAGFFDRGYDKEVADRLQESARNLGGMDLFVTDDNKIDKM